jgi:hypothetical protein
VTSKIAVQQQMCFDAPQKHYSFATYLVAEGRECIYQRLTALAPMPSTNLTDGIMNDAAVDLENYHFNASITVAPSN